MGTVMAKSIKPLFDGDPMKSKIARDAHSKKSLSKSHPSQMREEHTLWPMAHIMPDSATLSLTCSCCHLSQAVMLKVLVSQQVLQRVWLCEHCGEPQIPSATLANAISRWLERRGLYMKRDSRTFDKHRCLKVNHAVKLKPMEKKEPISDHS